MIDLSQLTIREIKSDFTRLRDKAVLAYRRDNMEVFNKNFDAAMPLYKEAMKRSPEELEVFYG